LPAIATTLPALPVLCRRAPLHVCLRSNDHSFREVDFRHELEFGLTNKLQAAIYLADWNYQRGNSVASPGLTVLKYWLAAGSL
jgi:hypothetical protein